MGASWDDVEVGDEITWTRTGTVRRVERIGDRIDCFAVEIDGVTKRLFDLDRSTLKSIEKPLVTFKPGDVVQGLGTNSGFKATIVPGGYVIYRGAFRGEYVTTPLKFTSRNYELVG